MTAWKQLKEYPEGFQTFSGNEDIRLNSMPVRLIVDAVASSEVVWPLKRGSELTCFAKRGCKL
jgi:hypothetical protein